MPADNNLPEVNDDLLAAISHGIDNEGALPDGSNQVNDHDEGDVEGAAAGDGAAGDDGTGTGGESEGDGAGDTGEGKDGDATGDDSTDENGQPRPRRADGTFKSAEEIAAEKAAADAAKAADPNAPKIDPKTGKPIEAKKADPLNDPIPKDLKPATQERIRSLINVAKEQTQQREAVQQNFDVLVKGIESTGTTPQQYGEMLSFMSLFNSNDPAQKMQALEIAQGFVVQLGTLMGVEIKGHDPMEQHQDLQHAVRTGQITADFAKEIARTRNQQGFHGQLTQQQRQQQQQEEAHSQETAKARTDLDSIQAQLRTRDGATYDAKKAALVPILQPVFANLRPSQWPQAFINAYEKMAKPTPVVPNGNPRPAIPKNQPLRAGKGNPGGGSGGTGLNTSATSALEALSGALDSMKG